MLTRLGDRRVEELEKRLRSMEDLVKRSVSNRQSGPSDAGFENASVGPIAPPVSDQSEAGPSDSSSNSNPAGENPQASDFGLSSPEGRCESTLCFSGLILFSVLFCSRW